MNTISREDRERFEREHAPAANFLCAARLRAELRTLRATSPRTGWETARLAELERWAADTGDGGAR